MLVRILTIPPCSGHFHFGGGEPLTFVELDWFRDDDGLIQTPEGRKRITDFIRQKRYFREDVPLLVLTGDVCFTIGYRAP